MKILVERKRGTRKAFRIRHTSRESIAYREGDLCVDFELYGAHNGKPQILYLVDVGTENGVKRRLTAEEARRIEARVIEFVRTKRFLGFAIGEQALEIVREQTLNIC